MHQGGLRDLKDAFQTQIYERVRAFRRWWREMVCFFQLGRDGLNNKMFEEVV